MKTIEEAKLAVLEAKKSLTHEAVAVLRKNLPNAETFRRVMAVQRDVLAEAKETIRRLEKGVEIDGAIQDAILVDTSALETLALANGNDIEERLRETLSRHRDEVKRLILGRTRRPTGAGVAPATARVPDVKHVIAQLSVQHNALDLMRSARGSTKLFTPQIEWERQSKKLGGQYKVIVIDGRSYVYRLAVTVNGLEYMKSLVEDTGSEY